MRLSQFGLTLCVQFLALSMPTSSNNLDEFDSIEITRNPNSQLESILKRFCNFLQLKTTALPTTCHTRSMVFKFGTASTKFFVYDRADVENRVHKAAEQLIRTGFHRDFMVKHLHAGLNASSFGANFVKALFTGVKEILPSEYFP